MAESDPWLPLCDAVTATGWKPERIRSLARRGTVPRKHGNGRGWLYQVTQELVAARATDAASPSAGHMFDTEEAARWRAVVADLQEEIVELRIGLTRAEDRAATAERVAAIEAAAKERVIAYLERTLSDARRPWWRRLIG